MASPQIDTAIASDFLAQAQQQALATSKGKLTDRGAGSPVTAILEATAAIASIVQSNLNDLAQNIENNRIAVFGITRSPGTFASVLIEARLQALYVDSFVLPKGYRFAANGQAFETTLDLVIPGFTDSGRVVAIALSTGTDSNVPQNASVVFPVVTRLASITLVQPAKGGTNTESDEDWKNRIYSTIRRRDTLISEDDFSRFMLENLGTGAIAVTIGRLKADKVTLQNGFVGVFGLNPDGSALTTSQIATLQDMLVRKAAMASVTVWSIETFIINVGVIVGILGGVSPDSISGDINRVIRDYLTPGKLQPGINIMNKAIEYLIQGIAGIQIGVVSVTLNGLAQPQSLPNRWTVAICGTVKVTTTTGTGVGNSYTF